MRTSYHNRYLQVDLGAKSWSTFALPEDVLVRYVGGKGIGAYLLARDQDPQADPFDPANPLLFLTGPLTGTQAPSMRFLNEDLPRRFKEEPLPDGPAAGHRFTEADIERLRADYYAVRGWDENGVPRPETLAALGVKYPRE